MKFIQTYRSPNYNQRPHDQISCIVLHYTDMINAKESIQRLCDPQYQVSAHYLIDDNGDVYELVSPLQRAWHAGVSVYNQQHNVNDFSIGIELQNKGETVNFEEKYPLQQMDALVQLLDFLTKTYHISPTDIVGHCDIAPDRKIDPGPHFNWNWLYEQGFGKKRSSFLNLSG